MHIYPARAPIKAPNIYDGSIIMPLETASGQGKVSSTANPQEMGMIGITENPINARFTVKNHLLVGREIRPIRINKIAEPDVRLIRSLNFAVLSRQTPSTKEPKTPKNMNTAPKMALSTPEYPKGQVTAATTAPREVQIPQSIVKEMQSKIQLLLRTINLRFPRKFIGSSFLLAAAEGANSGFSFANIINAIVGIETTIF